MILQQWGFKSGKRSEVFLNIAKKDAALIQQMDAAPDDESKKVAGMLKSALGVDAKAGQEDILQAMGVDEAAAKNIDAAIAQKRTKDRTSDVFKNNGDKTFINENPQQMDTYTQADAKATADAKAGPKRDPIPLSSLLLQSGGKQPAVRQQFSRSVPTTKANVSSKKKTHQGPKLEG
jgi:hypothetical protein